MRADGFLLIDKPAGPTSFRVVDHVRRALLTAAPELQAPRGRRRRGGPRPPRFKCGHTGTLDPDATGLLVVLTGKGSRLGPFLCGLDKTYAGTVRFGTATDTLDAAGKATAAAEPPAAPEAVEAVLPGFRGDILQVPPLVSALKRDGKPLYARVRAGEQPTEPDPRPVRIDRLEITGARWPDPDSGACEVDLLVECSSGTYIRSLARDLAVAAGSVGHLAALRRLAVGPFDVADAVDRAMDLSGGELLERILPLAAALPGAPELPLDSERDALIRSGGQPDAAWLDGLAGGLPPTGALLKFLGPDRRLTAVVRMTENGPEVAAMLAAGPATGEPSTCE